MINYQSRNPPNDFTMLENEALFSLSADAYYLYAILRNLDKDADNSTKVLVRRTNLNKNAFQQAKNELINKGWLETKKLYANVFAFYIGKEVIKKYKHIKKTRKKNS